MYVFLAPTKKLSIHVEILRFQCFPQNAVNAKIDNRAGHGKLKNGCGKVMEKYFVQSLGTVELYTEMRCSIIPMQTPIRV